jgi:hypothetical protein
MRFVSIPGTEPLIEPTAGRIIWILRVIHRSRKAFLASRAHVVMTVEDERLVSMGH